MGGDGRIAWSPDGHWLAFKGVASASGEQIYTVHPDGTDLRRVTDMGAFNPSPGVSGPNGTPGRTDDPSWGPTTG